ncbi:MAG: DUF748 domain-containing protein [Betaproteobacteria bacterium]|nr:DUF748 domain-containing protein [Betaproteobacteria bacterium]
MSHGRRWIRRGLLVALALVLLLGALAAAIHLGGPALARRHLPALLGEALGRAVTLGDVEIDIARLRAAVTDLRVAEAGGGDAPAFSLARAEVELAWASLARRAPMVTALRLTEPRLRVVRQADGSLSWDDVLRRLRERPARPDEPPPSFLLTGVALRGGDLLFSDRQLGGEHRIEALRVDLPRLSGFPEDRDQPVTPSASGRLDGAEISLSASTRPFDPQLPTRAELSLAPLDLVAWLRYLPMRLPVEVRSARLAGSASLSFSRPPQGAPELDVSAKAELTGVELREPGGAPLLSLPALRVGSLSLQPLAARYQIGEVVLEQPALTLHRRAGQTRFLQAVLDALPAPQPAKPPSADKPDAPAVAWSVESLDIQGGAIDLRDQRFAPRPLALRVKDLRATLGRFGSQAGEPMPLTLRLGLDSGETLQARASLVAQPLRLDAQVALAGLSLKRWWWLAEPHLRLDAVDGRLGVRTAIALREQAGETRLSISGLSAELRSLAMRERGGARDLLRLPTVTLAGLDLDLTARSIAVRRFGIEGGELAIQRLADGRIDLIEALRPPDVAPASARAASTAPASAPATAPVTASAPATAPASAARPWRWQLGQLAVSGLGATLRHAGLSEKEQQAGGDLVISQLGLQLEGASSAPGAQARLALKAGVGRNGSLQTQGSLSLSPLAAQLRVDAWALSLLPAQPLVAPFITFTLNSGRVTASGDLALATRADGSPTISWNGDASVTDVEAFDRASGEELFRWKSLALARTEVVSEPLKVEIGQVALADFFVRLILRPDGRLNLRELVARPEEPAGAASAAGPGSAAAGPGSAAARAALRADPPPVAAEAAPDPSMANPVRVVNASARAALPVRIGRVSFTNGNVDFSDFFIKPNYSANITGLVGGISALAPDTAGDLELRGRVDNAGRVEITGRVNPFARVLQLDIDARATDIDLPRTTPYAVKYLGYGIEKGKLSAHLQYRIEDRQLRAENRITLDQLTFGPRVESATATQLPVLFAVSLLKDRHGVIDVNLPIGGSLDDPDFSVGGLVLRIIFNLIVKAVTAPFSMLAGLFGGDAEEHASVPFEPGRIAIAGKSESRLRAMGKAMADRPGLRLDLTGHADPLVDEPALRRLLLERRLKTAKLRETRTVVPAGGIDTVPIEPAERLPLLRLVHQAAGLVRPRAAAGQPAELPVAEMEAALMAAIEVTPAQLADLASARALAVKEWLSEQGGVAGDRIFLVAGGAPVAAAAATAGAAPEKPAHGEAAASGPRVDLRLK